MLSFRARLAVVGYVLLTFPIMNAFLLGPLALLIAGSRPQGRRAWYWLVVLTLWIAMWAALPGSILDELERAAAVLSAGIGVLILLLTPGSVSARALRATGAVVVGTASLATAVGIRWRDVELAIVRQGTTAPAAIADLLNWFGVAPSAENLADMQAVSEGLRPLAPFFPGVIALLIFAGLCLAAMLAPRITGRAVMPLPGRFEAFRFSDHVVWTVILGLVGLLFLGASPVAGPAASLLTFGMGLYALRGSAVMAMALQAASRVSVVLLMVGALFLWPLVVGGLALLGLADIWLDFRRRMAPPPSGGLDR